MSNVLPDYSFNLFLMHPGRRAKGTGKYHRDAEARNRVLDTIQPAAKSRRLAVGSVSGWLNFVRAEGADRSMMREARRLWMEFAGTRAAGR